MISIYQNISGTTMPRFKIGKHGSSIHSLNTIPTNIVGEDGDWCMVNTAVPQLLKKINGEWINNQAKYITTVTTNETHSTVSAEDIVLFDHSDDITYTIDTVAPKGYTITVKDISGTADNKPITIQGINGVTFDEMSSIIIDGNFSSITLISNGVNYYII